MRNSHPTPHRAPVALILIVVLVGLTILGGVLAWLGWQFSLLDPRIAAVLRVGIFLTPVAGGILGGAIAWRRWASVELLKADRIVALTAAQQQRFPSGLHSLSFHDSSKQLPAPIVEPPLLAAPDLAIPTFAQLLDAGKIGTGRPMLLGFRADSGQPIEGSWLDLYSVGVGGMTGSGKTWLSAFLVAQSVAAGARLIVVDPHAGDKESLATRLSGLSSAYVCTVSSDGAAIPSALHLAHAKLTQRIAGKGGNWPLLLIVDEWTSLLRGKLGELLTATALDIAEQGRKYGVFCLLAAQAWQIDAAGPVRDRLASHYTMRTRGDQFRYQMGLRGSAPLDTMFLKPGEAYFLSNRGELCKVVIPRMDAADLARIGATLDTPAASVGQPFGFVPATAAVTPSAQIIADNRPKSSQNVTGPLPATTASQSATGVSPEAARAAALFRGGASPAEIVKELRGVGSKEGSRYQAALNEVLELIRIGMRGT